MKQVIFADGTFIDGSTSELSCDGPLREPFVVFCQVSLLIARKYNAFIWREVSLNLWCYAFDGSLCNAMPG